MSNSTFANLKSRIQATFAFTAPTKSRWSKKNESTNAVSTSTSTPPFHQPRIEAKRREKKPKQLKLKLPWAKKRSPVANEPSPPPPTLLLPLLLPNSHQEEYILPVRPPSTLSKNREESEQQESRSFSVTAARLENRILELTESVRRIQDAVIVVVNDREPQPSQLYPQQQQSQKQRHEQGQQSLQQHQLLQQQEQQRQKLRVSLYLLNNNPMLTMDPVSSFDDDLAAHIRDPDVPFPYHYKSPSENIDHVTLDNYDCDKEVAAIMALSSPRDCFFHDSSLDNHLSEKRSRLHGWLQETERSKTRRQGSYFEDHHEESALSSQITPSSPTSSNTSAPSLLVLGSPSFSPLVIPLTTDHLSETHHHHLSSSSAVGISLSSTTKSRCQTARGFQTSSTEGQPKERKVLAIRTEVLPTRSMLPMVAPTSPPHSLRSSSTARSMHFKSPRVAPAQRHSFTSFPSPRRLEAIMNRVSDEEQACQKRIWALEAELKMERDLLKQRKEETRHKEQQPGRKQKVSEATTQESYQVQIKYQQKKGRTGPHYQHFCQGREAARRSMDQVRFWLFPTGQGCSTNSENNTSMRKEGSIYDTDVQAQAKATPLRRDDIRSPSKVRDTPPKVTAFRNWVEEGRSIRA